MMPDGSRLHVVIPDVTRRHMAVNIRKFVLQAHSLDELVALGTLTSQAARFLEAAVASGLNVLVSGGTQVGKTTLLDAAHRQLGGPIVLVWDNLSTHTSTAMAALIAARPWLTVYQLPPYAHELNPVEPVWSHLKRSLANLTKHTVAELTVLVKIRLKRMQYRPRLLVGFLAKHRARVRTVPVTPALEGR